MDISEVDDHYLELQYGTDNVQYSDESPHYINLAVYFENTEIRSDSSFFKINYLKLAEDNMLHVAD